MEVIIRGENLEVTEAIKEYTLEKIERLEKYLRAPEDVKITVVFKVYREIQVVEITVPTKNFILRVEEGQQDLYAAIDVALDKLERQIRKHKTRLRRFGRQRKFEDAFIYDLIEDIEEQAEEAKIIRRKTIDIKPMTEEEAILQMELLGHEFFLYKDAETMAPAVVYKRKNGDYGLIVSE